MKVHIGTLSLNLILRTLSRLSLKKLGFNSKIITVTEHSEISQDKKSFLMSVNTSPILNEETGVTKEKGLKNVCSFQGCSKRFGKPSRLLVHERTHTGERPFQCPYNGCNRSYTRRFHLTRHVTISHCAISNASEVFSCDICGKIFSNVYSLKKHCTNIHNRNHHSCSACGASFRKQQHLKTHSFEHTGIKPYLCSYPGCEKRFTIPSQLNRHSLSHVKGRYICPYESCEERFDGYSDLRHHLTTSHPKKCDICGLEFSQLSKLKSHFRVHSAGEKKEVYFCPFTPCERYYFEARNLYAHIRCKHNKNYVGYKCLLCDKQLVTKQKLKLHMKIHSPDYQHPIKKSKSRKSRKDKGVSRTDYAKLLSGYQSDRELEGVDASEEADVSNHIDMSELQEKTESALIITSQIQTVLMKKSCESNSTSQSAPNHSFPSCESQSASKELDQLQVVGLEAEMVAAVS